MLKTSAFQIFHGGNLTLIDSIDKSVFLVEIKYCLLIVRCFIKKDF